MNHQPQYDLNDPVFKVNLKYKRIAREHVLLASLRSSAIHVEVAETVSHLQIPVKYHVHYHFKSITGIDAEQNPIYGDHHILELSLPELYPLEACRITMLTDVWHPNVKSEGRFKGRVCGNSEGFGLSYDLYQLVLRVGEILQYKNYHAVHTPPFPEDTKVAEWVVNYAEPNNLIDKEKEIYVDDTPLVDTDKQKVPDPPPPAAVALPPQPVAPMPEPLPQALPPEPPKIKISPIVKHPSEQEKKIVIKPKN